MEKRSPSIWLHFCPHGSTSWGHACSWCCLSLIILFLRFTGYNLPLCSCTLVLMGWWWGRWRYRNVGSGAQCWWNRCSFCTYYSSGQHSSYGTSHGVHGEAFVPKMVTHDNSLDLFYSFYVNKFVDHHAFEIAFWFLSYGHYITYCYPLPLSDNKNIHRRHIDELCHLVVPNFLVSVKITRPSVQEKNSLLYMTRVSLMKISQRRKTHFSVQEEALKLSLKLLAE